MRGVYGVFLKFKICVELCKRSKEKFDMVHYC